MRAVIERFQILERIGSGGEGEAWLALDRSTLKTVVCKKRRTPDLSASLTGNQSAVSSTSVLSLLEGTRRVLPVAEIQLFSSADAVWSVCPYVDGIALETLVANNPDACGGLGIAMEILYQLSLRIVSLHQQRVMHGDVSPANVLIGVKGKVSLIDFGQSAQFGEQASAWGARGFIAPEKLNQGVACAESDAFSFGCLIYWLLTGRLPEMLINGRVAVDLIAPRMPGPLCSVKEDLLALAAGLTGLGPNDRVSMQNASRTVKTLQQEIPSGGIEGLAALVTRHVRLSSTANDCP